MSDERAELLRMIDELSEHIASTLDALGGVTCPGCDVPPVRRRGRVIFAHRTGCVRVVPQRENGDGGLLGLGTGSPLRGRAPTSLPGCPAGGGGREEAGAASVTDARPDSEDPATVCVSQCARVWNFVNEHTSIAGRPDHARMGS